VVAESVATDEWTRNQILGVVSGGA